ncbi:hypothetical protein AVEN_240191-1 [Araneus ventricosus]|uniref:Uncharacterized protein n=1 Tax=Araneus ventricosus TaxID=182803 RepID=A0A4Y2V5R2_ARAVE|nr:hypothetical protein AVEN_240191-1 [Araneus ventricosus]
MLVSGKWENNHLSDVWFVPEVSRNLFSLSRAVDKGYDFKVDKNGCYLSKDGRVRLAGKRPSRGLYALKLKVLMPEKSVDVLMAVVDTMQLWPEKPPE